VICSSARLVTFVCVFKEAINGGQHCRLHFIDIVMTDRYRLRVNFIARSVDWRESCYRHCVRGRALLQEN
jgi:hypothetical protein